MFGYNDDVIILLFLTSTSFALKATYPAYGTYDYSHQMPQPAAQAAYGAYPPTYPAQVLNFISAFILEMLCSKVKIICLVSSKNRCKE